MKRTIVAGVALMLAFIASRIFGHSELGLLRSRLSGLLRSLVVMRRQAQLAGVHSVHRLQGNRQWEELWLGLTEAVQELPITQVELDVNCPALHEGYHGAWKRHVTVGEERLWRFDLPLVAAEHQPC